MDWRVPIRRIVRLLGLMAGIAVSATSCQVIGVRFVNPRVTVTMVERAIELHDETGVWAWPDQRWRGIDALGHVPQAVMAAEDQRFWLHPGFDPEAIGKAIEWNRKHPDRPKGASTITQQVARNVFLWQKRSWLRKGLEAWYTVLLELFLPKERILELYLNVAETGPAQFGFEAASRHWYGKPAVELTEYEAASLAAILPKPQSWAPTGPYVVSRARWIVAHPAPIDSAQALLWESWEKKVSPGPTPARPRPTGVPAPGPPVPAPGPIVLEPGPTVPEPGPTVLEPGPVMPEPGPFVPEPGPAMPQPGPAAPEPLPAVPESGAVVPEPGPAVPDTAE